MSFVLVFQLVFSSLLSSGSAFWWSTPTSTESTPVLKQVPVGYFRTYTYQPLAYSQRYSPYTPFVAKNYPYEDPSISWNIPALPVNSAKFQSTTSTTPTTTTSWAANMPQYSSPTLQSFQNSVQDNQRLNSYLSSTLEPHSGNPAVPQNTPTYPQITLNSDLSNVQYLPGPVSSQIQFVPCMCPVSISVGAKGALENRAVTEMNNFLQRDDGETAPLSND